MSRNFHQIAVACIAVAWTVSMQPAPARAQHDHMGHDHMDMAHGGTSTDGAPGKAEDAKRTIRIEATDYAFDVKQIQVRAGETIRFVITNSSPETHEFAIASPEENEAHRAMMREMPGMTHNAPNMVTIAPGEVKELVWRFGRDRNVEFACNIGDHAEEGMKGAFRIAQ